MKDRLEDKKREFNFNLWDHSADAFQAQFDSRRELDKHEIEFFDVILQVASEPDEEKAIKKLEHIVSNNTDRFGLLLQLLGLTRNKILTDLRASGQAKEMRISIPSSYAGLPNSRAWKIAGPYLLTRIRSVFSKVDPVKLTVRAMLEALNQATWPGFIRQERAKRSGHEAEYRLATLMASLDLPFQPEEKAENPLCRDAQIGGVSFDLVVPNIKAPKILIKSTVHTANIGQYGESKDHLEISEAKELIEKNFEKSSRPLLLAFIDGVGFQSNRAGLHGVLEKSDEFCQFKTIWKAAMLASVLTQGRVDLALERKAIDFHSAFLKRYGLEKKVFIREDMKSAVGWIDAGDGLVKVQKPT